MDPSGLAAIRDLDWTSEESRRRASVALGTSITSESLISALSQVMTKELSAARLAAASAIVRLDILPDQRPTGWRDGLLALWPHAGVELKLRHWEILGILGHERAVIGDRHRGDCSVLN